MAQQDQLDHLGFHLFVPLCNQCRNREHHPGEGQELTCRVLGEIPSPLLTCKTDECPHFEIDEEQAELYKGLI